MLTLAARAWIPLFLFAGLALPQATPIPWQAGVAKVDISPTEPIWLAGFGSRTKPSEGVLQRIYVKALALKDQNGTVSVLVTSDLLGFNHEMSATVAQQAQRKYGLPRERLAINSSHTHSAPVTDTVLRPAYPYGPEQEPVIRRYTEKLLGQVVDVIGAAIKDLSPASIAFDQGLAGFAVNRRRVAHREYPGPVDHDVPVLRITAPDGKLRAIVFGYACHATSLSLYEASGDWPGFAQQELEDAHPGATALFVTGCGADANPLPRREVKLSKAYGMILASAVNQVLEGKMRPVSGPLRAAFETVEIPFQTPPTRAEFEERLKDPRQRSHAQFMLKRLDKEGKLPDVYPYPVQVWQFGRDVTWILLGGEVVVDYSLRLKKQYGWDNVWVSGYSNDVFAYIPSLRVLKEGGYEGGGAMIPYGQSGPFRAPVEEIIIEKVDELVKRVSPSTSAGLRSLDNGPLRGTAQAVVVKGSPLAHTAQVFPVSSDGRLVTGGARAQVEQCLRNLDAALGDAGASLGSLVKINIAVTRADVAAEAEAVFEQRFGSGAGRPAVSLVTGRLPHPEALVAMDAVAVANRAVRTSSVAVLPAGPRVYISGQAVPGDLRHATAATLKSLQDTLQFLRLNLADVVQVKAFVQPMSEAAAVREEVRAFFGGNAPPLALVEWQSKIPIEIELIAQAPGSTGPRVEYLTPPGEKRARVYTRVARVHHPESIYISGLFGTGGAPEAQVRDIFASLQATLGRARSDLRHLVKATYYVTDEPSSLALNQLRPDYYEDGRAPAASKAMTTGTGLDGRTVTMDMIAVPAL